MYTIYIQKYSSLFDYDIYDYVDDKATAEKLVKQLLNDPHIENAYYTTPEDDLRETEEELLNTEVNTLWYD